MQAKDLSAAQDLFSKLQTARRAREMLRAGQTPLSVRLAVKSGPALDIVLTPDAQTAIRERCLSDTEAIITNLESDLAQLGVSTAEPVA